MLHLMPLMVTMEASETGQDVGVCPSGSWLNLNCIDHQYHEVLSIDAVTHICRASDDG